MKVKKSIGNACARRACVTGAHGVACGTVQARQSALKGGYAGGNATTLQPPANGFCRLMAAFSRLTLSTVAHNRSNWVKVGQTGQGLVKPPVKPAPHRQRILYCNKLRTAVPTTVKPSQTQSNLLLSSILAAPTTAKEQPHDFPIGPGSHLKNSCSFAPIRVSKTWSQPWLETGQFKAVQAKSRSFKAK